MPVWRPLCPQDRTEYLAMVKAFYRTDAVIKPIPPSYAEATFDELMRSNAYASCLVCETAQGLVGYALLAYTFSQEAGGKVCWIEELYIKEAFRGQGFSRAFFEIIFASLPADVKRVRLEIERDNTRAVNLYRSYGFDFLEYDQMIWER